MGRLNLEKKKKKKGGGEQKAFKIIFKSPLLDLMQKGRMRPRQTANQITGVTTLVLPSGFRFKMT